jgi:hypothetical protein
VAGRAGSISLSFQSLASYSPQSVMSPTAATPRNHEDARWAYPVKLTNGIPTPQAHPASPCACGSESRLDHTGGQRPPLHSPTSQHVPCQSVWLRVDPCPGFETLSRGTLQNRGNGGAETAQFTSLFARLTPW